MPKPKPNHKKQFLDLLVSMAYSQNQLKTFQDFLSMAAIALSNQFYKSQKAESRYQLLNISTASYSPWLSKH